MWASYKATGRWPSYAFIYEWVQDFTAAFDRYPFQPDMPYIAVYPSSPGDVPQSMHDVAYPDATDPPVIFDLPIEMIGQHVPSRSSSKSLRESHEIVHTTEVTRLR